MRILSAFLSGLLFGAGLLLAGMSDPAKVLAFLDVAGAWDPSLALVMGAALSVTAGGMALLRTRARPWLEAQFEHPPTRPLEAKLVTGGILFGIGWGLAGICPGPAFVLLGSATPAPLEFAAAMCSGFYAYAWLARRLQPLRA